MKLKKKGIGFLNRYLIGFLVFSLIISSWLLIPDQGDDVDGNSGFWGAYDYTIPSNEMSSLDATDNVSIALRDVVCDINPESNSCGDIDRTALGGSGNIATLPIQGIVQGGYGALVTVQKTLGIAKVTVENSGRIFGLDPLITDIIVSIILITVTFTIVLIIFNRSDLG